jgi:MinD-like ATPase involved in chromosome partitioning or flagellar assembly
MNADVADVGTVATFYSYKGGVGRTFALANVAVILASWGQRVLCIDWDLDAPGLSHYFRPYSAPARSGLVEIIERIGSGAPARWRDVVTPLSIGMPEGVVEVDLIPAGREDATYAARVQNLAWDELYESANLGFALEQLRSEWVSGYDFVLIDSRTGITDIGAICTAQLPDIVVVGFTANEQSLGGAIDVVQKAQAARNRLPYDRPGLLVLPMPCRFDSREEYKQAAEWRQRFAIQLAPFYETWLPKGLEPSRVIDLTTVPYLSYWSFGERLAVTEERATNPDLVSYYFENIAALLTHHLDRSELLIESREHYTQSARRVSSTHGFRYDVYLSGGSDLFDLVSELTASLERHGLTVAHNDAPEGGTAWGPELDTLLRDSQFYVPVISSESARSRWQQSEIRSFLAASTDPDSTRTIIPIVADQRGFDAMPTLLRSFQGIDGTRSPDSIATKLVEAIDAVSPPPSSA